MTGESYGGIYVPQLTFAIHNFNSDPNTTDEEKINLKGMLVGNGMTNYEYDATPASVPFAYYRGLLSNEVYDTVVANNCTREANWMFPDDQKTQVCTEALAKWDDQVTNINIYNIYGDCNSNAQEEILKAQDPEMRNHMIVNEAGESLTVTSDGRSTVKSKGYFTAQDYTPWALGKNLKMTPPCVYSANIDAYLNNKDV